MNSAGISSYISKFIPDREFVKNFITLITGNVVAQLIPIAASPFLTRIFSPTEFGLLGLFMVITSSLSVIGGGRFEIAIMLPEKEEEGKNVFALTILTSVVISCLIAVLTFSFHDLIILKLKNPDFSQTLYIVPLVILFISAYQALNYWLIRKKEFRRNAINKIGQTATSTAGSIAMGLSGIPYGIVWGYALGWLAVNILGWFQLKASGFNTNGVNRKGIRKMFNQHRDFLTYNTFPSLLNAISSNLPTLFINLFFAATVTGYFTLCRQVLFVPVSFISYALSQVLFQRASSNIQQGISIKGEFNLLLILLSIIGGISFLVLLIAGPYLFSIVFGEQWNEAGEYARILAFSYSGHFIVSTFSILLPALKRIKTISVWQVLYFLAIMILYFSEVKEVKMFLYLYLFIDVLMYSIYFVLILNAVNSYEKSIRKQND